MYIIDGLQGGRSRRNGAREVNSSVLRCQVPHGKRPAARRGYMVVLELDRGQPAEPGPGVQYAATEYTDLLAGLGVAISMAAVGKLEDHGFAERLMRTIREEEMCRGCRQRRPRSAFRPAGASERTDRSGGPVRSVRGLDPRQVAPPRRLPRRPRRAEAVPAPVVEALADLHVEKHGDTGKSVAALPAGRSTRESLVRIGDLDLGCVMSLAFSPDGSRLASGSRDRTLKVWDLARLVQRP